MTSLVKTTREGELAIVTLNLPEKRNALSVDLRHALIEALEPLQIDPTCRAIVVTGAGGTFCAGGDISAMRSDDIAGSRYRLILAQRSVRMLAAGTKPTIAAVEGFALGGGMALALACDRVVASPTAKFGASYSKVGLMADMGLLWTLPRRVGSGKAAEILMLGDTFDASEAAAIGVVDKIAGEQSVLDTAVEEAKRFAAAPPLAIALTKNALGRGVGDLEVALAMELDGQAILYRSSDHAEARAAFGEKRAPVFSGT